MAIAVCDAIVNQVHHEASIAITNRQDKLDRAADMVETNLTLLGATAVEDRLQNGVPQTIEALAMAGIKVWVLTGDKLETAINVGYSSSLIRPESNVRMPPSPRHRRDYFENCKLFVIHTVEGQCPNDIILAQFKRAFSDMVESEFKVRGI